MTKQKHAQQRILGNNSVLPLRDEVAFPIRARYQRWETQQMNEGTNEGPSRALSLTPHLMWTHKHSGQPRQIMEGGGRRRGVSEEVYSRMGVGRGFRCPDGQRLEAKQSVHQRLMHFQRSQQDGGRRRPEAVLK